MSSFIIQVQNIPASAMNIDIREFFQGLEIPNGGVALYGGRYGDAFVTFKYELDLLNALGKDGQLLLGKPVRIYLAKPKDVERSIGNTIANALPVQGLTNALDEAYTSRKSDLHSNNGATFKPAPTKKYLFPVTEKWSQMTPGSSTEEMPQSTNFLKSDRAVEAGNENNLCYRAGASNLMQNDRQISNDINIRSDTNLTEMKVLPETKALIASTVTTKNISSKDQRKNELSLTDIMELIKNDPISINNDESIRIALLNALSSNTQAVETVKSVNRSTSKQNIVGKESKSVPYLGDVNLDLLPASFNLKKKSQSLHAESRNEKLKDNLQQMIEDNLQQMIDNSLKEGKYATKKDLESECKQTKTLREIIDQSCMNLLPKTSSTPVSVDRDLRGAFFPSVTSVKDDKRSDKNEYKSKERKRSPTTKTERGKSSSTHSRKKDTSTNKSRSNVDCNADSRKKSTSTVSREHKRSSTHEKDNKPSSKKETAKTMKKDTSTYKSRSGTSAKDDRDDSRGKSARHVSKDPKRSSTTEKDQQASSKKYTSKDKSCVKLERHTLSTKVSGEHSSRDRHSVKKKSIDDGKPSNNVSQSRDHKQSSSTKKESRQTDEATNNSCLKPDHMTGTQMKVYPDSNYPTSMTLTPADHINSIKREPEIVHAQGVAVCSNSQKSNEISNKRHTPWTLLDGHNIWDELSMTPLHDGNDIAHSNVDKVKDTKPVLTIKIKTEFLGQKPGTSTRRFQKKSAATRNLIKNESQKDIKECEVTQTELSKETQMAASEIKDWEQMDSKSLEVEFIKWINKTSGKTCSSNIDETKSLELPCASANTSKEEINLNREVRGESQENLNRNKGMESVGFNAGERKCFKIQCQREFGQQKLINADEKKIQIAYKKYELEKIFKDKSISSSMGIESVISQEFDGIKKPMGIDNRARNVMDLDLGATEYQTNENDGAMVSSKCFSEKEMSAISERCLQSETVSSSITLEYRSHKNYRTLSQDVKHSIGMPVATITHPEDIAENVKILRTSNPSRSGDEKPLLIDVSKNNRIENESKVEYCSSIGEPISYAGAGAPSAGAEQHSDEAETCSDEDKSDVSTKEESFMYRLNTSEDDPLKNHTVIPGLQDRPVTSTNESKEDSRNSKSFKISSQYEEIPAPVYQSNIANFSHQHIPIPIVRNSYAPVKGDMESVNFKHNETVTFGLPPKRPPIQDIRLAILTEGSHSESPTKTFDGSLNLESSISEGCVDINSRLTKEREYNIVKRRKLSQYDTDDRQSCKQRNNLEEMAYHDTDDRLGKGEQKVYRDDANWRKDVKGFGMEKNEETHDDKDLSKQSNDHLGSGMGWHDAGDLLTAADRDTDKPLEQDSYDNKFEIFSCNIQRDRNMLKRGREIEKTSKCDILEGNEREHLYDQTTASYIKSREIERDKASMGSEKSSSRERENATKGNGREINCWKLDAQRKNTQQRSERYAKGDSRKSTPDKYAKEKKRSKAVNIDNTDDWTVLTTWLDDSLTEGNVIKKVEKRTDMDCPLRDKYEPIGESWIAVDSWDCEVENRVRKTKTSNEPSPFQLFVKETTRSNKSIPKKHNEEDTKKDKDDEPSPFQLFVQETKTSNEMIRTKCTEADTRKDMNDKPSPFQLFVQETKTSNESIKTKFTETDTKKDMDDKPSPFQLHIWKMGQLQRELSFAKRAKRDQDTDRRFETAIEDQQQTQEMVSNCIGMPP